MSNEEKASGEAHIRDVHNRIEHLEDEVRKLRDIILDLTKDMPKGGEKEHA